MTLSNEAKAERAWDKLFDVMGEVITCASEPKAKRLLEALEKFPNIGYTEFELEILSILKGVAEDVLDAKDEITAPDEYHII